MLGKFFDWLGGGKREEEPGQEVLYKDYSIRPTARRDGGHWLTAGVITKTFDLILWSCNHTRQFVQVPI